MKKNYRFIIMYDGSRYYGWQRQPNKETIQGKIESVLRKMCDDESLEVIGAGRTDAGVHAKNMVANVVMDTDMDVVEIRDYLNQYLPDDIAVKSVSIAGDRFHARYNAIGKTYQYTCYYGEVKPVFNRKYMYVLDKAPNIDKMKEASKCLLGEHDFRNFCMNPRMKKSTVRKVDNITIEKIDEQIVFTIHGTGFLQNMVRIIVGTLLEIGYGTMRQEDLELALHSTERMKAGPTAPAQGLCMLQVDYQ